MFSWLVAVWAQIDEWSPGFARTFDISFFLFWLNVEQDIYFLQTLDAVWPQIDDLMSGHLMAQTPFSAFCSKNLIGKRGRPTQHPDGENIFKGETPNASNQENILYFLPRSQISAEQR